MSILKKALIRCTGYGLAQRLLLKNVEVAQYLMGIGSGGDPVSSGEEAVFTVLQKMQKPPYCVFDVGSNIGQFLQLASKELKSCKFSIHCFEPGREAFKELVKTAHGDNRVHLNNFGIGKEEYEAVLHLDSMSLAKRRLDHFGIRSDDIEKVEVKTIDKYCTDNVVERIDLLKLDIEGYELDALTGAKQMFQRKAIGLVTFEFGGCNIDTHTFFQDFWYFFLETNMKIYRMTPSGFLCPVQKYQEIHEQFRTTNFLAVPLKSEVVP